MQCAHSQIKCRLQAASVMFVSKKHCGKSSQADMPEGLEVDGEKYDIVENCGNHRRRER